MPVARIHCTAFTHAGHIRAGNEDAIALSSTDELPLARWAGALPVRQGWALVADGMGGHVGGEVASQIAVELLRPVMGRLHNAEDVDRALNAANAGLYDTMMRHPELAGMGTTIAGVVLRGDRALAFNVGDSRIYTYREGVLAQISTDDVLSGYMLTQCLGGTSEPNSINPHARDILLAPGMKLLVCSDGLTGMVADSVIAKALGDTSPDAAEVLVRAALEAGGTDNVSTIVVEVHDD